MAHSYEEKLAQFGRVLDIMDRLREKSTEIGKAEQAIAAASTAPKKLSQPILQSNTGNIEGYSITNQFGVVSVSRIITLTSNDGRHETDEAVDAALHELSAKVDSLTANAVVNICIGYTGIESMTLAPRVLLTVSGTAVTVKPQTVVATGIPVPETTDTTVPATSS